MTLPNYTGDRVFSKWKKKFQECYTLVGKTNSSLKACFIDAVNPLALSKPQVIITNSIISNNLQIVAKVQKTANSFYGMYHVPYTWHSHEIKKNFNCFINRMDPIRQSWFYQLIRRGLIDQGYVSFNMDISQIPVLSHLSSMQAFEQQFIQHCGIFQVEHELARTMVPYKNFVESKDFDLAHVILSSKFSIILETYFDNNDIVTWSEKTFRCLQLPRPWLLFGPARAVDHLRNLGFDVLDDVCDHDSYDQISWDIDRQAKILDMAQDMCKINLAPLIPRLEKAAKHNQNLLNTWWETFDVDFQNTLTNAQQQLLAIS